MAANLERLAGAFVVTGEVDQQVLSGRHHASSGRSRPSEPAERRRRLLLGLHRPHPGSYTPNPGSTVTVITTGTGAVVYR